MPFGGNRKKSFRVSEKNVWRGKKRNRQDKAERGRGSSSSGYPHAKPRRLRRGEAGGRVPGPSITLE